MHSSRVFRVKLIERLIYEVQKSESHTISYQFLLLSTIVLNDIVCVTESLCKSFAGGPSYGKKSTCSVITFHKHIQVFSLG